jgi:FG-GAP repeat protein
MLRALVVAGPQGHTPSGSHILSVAPAPALAPREMVTMRRTALAVLLVLLAASATAAGPPLVRPAVAEIPSNVAADFDRDGFPDLAVGVIGENDVAGAVNVLYGAGGGLSGAGAQVFFQVGSAGELLDRFGTTQAAGDFNGDGFADLAVAASGEDVGRAFDAGAVSVLYGSAAGLTAGGGHLFTQVGSAPESWDNFGWSLAAGDFNRDGFADLAAGAPGESVGRVGGAGAVSVVYGSAAGLATAGGRLFTQTGSAVETGDAFGWALAAGDFDGDGFADLAAGAPDETVGGGSGVAAGAVSVLPGSPAGLTTTGPPAFTQVGGAVEATDYFGSALAAGDFNQDGFADLGAAARGEAVGSVGDAGAVSVLYGSGGGLTVSGGRLFTQVGSAAERFDLFGFALAAGDFDGDGFVDLAAGAPWEDVGTVGQAGAVSAVYGSAAGLTAGRGQLFTQVGSAVEANDQFGSQLAAGDFDANGFADLAAAAPAEAVGTIRQAGAVSIVQGSAGGLTRTGAQVFTQDSPGVPGGAEPFDGFGGSEFVP